MIRLFCGYDPREAIGFHVFVASVLEHASLPVAITPLDSRGLPMGSNAFTTSRFLVPYLCGFKGKAIFADAADMLMMGDVVELADLADDDCAVQVVPQSYQTRHPRKYLGTTMACDNPDYARKNWASLMIINCAHKAWAHCTPTWVASQRTLDLLQLRHVRNEEIGFLPAQWNVLADEGQPLAGAKLLHWTAGIPGFKHYVDAPGSRFWHAQRARMETTA